MELLKLSKFKLQLHALICDVRELKEKERNASQQVQLALQKQKQSEEEFNQKLTEFRAELGFSNELRHKLERKVTCLENENNLLENKKKELEGTLQSLLESREDFLKAYEDSTYEMKRAIEDRDRKIGILSETLRVHLLLFDSISKEASSINKLMDDARHALSQKEDVGMYSFSLSYLQREISTKELLLQNLISENKGLHSEIGSLGIVIKKIQDAVTRMSEEDRRTFTSLMEGQEECLSIRQSEKLRTPDTAQIKGKDSHPKSSMSEESTGSYHALASCSSPEVQEDSIKSPLKKDNKINCYISEASTSILR
ncbi:uncharacterized protein [Nicotiana tomentosiformis]|uniref:uncharacterized protein n=1 Tax=Nicotiana tomentosiformis TaxID=4098 RepID=UPI00388C5305